MTTAAVRLTPRQRDALDEALDPHDLTPSLRAALERHLTDYRNVDRPATRADIERWQARDRDLITTARRLQQLIASWSLQDSFEAEARGASCSEFQGQLAARIEQWEARRTRGRSATRPVDWNRRILLYRAMGALDDAGVTPSGHRDAARVRALRVLLTVADTIDQRKPTSGSLRLIQDVFKHYRARAHWGERSVLRFRYEHDAAWPRQSTKATA